MKIISSLLFCLFPLFSLFGQGDSLAGRPLLTDSFQVVGKAITGKAGMYSSRADGTRTANGETFSNLAFTAACNKFKFDTWVRVTNLSNKKSVILRINDRTSKKPGAAIMEISRSAVTELGFLRSGYAKVKIEKIILSNSKSVKNGQVIEKKETDSTLAFRSDLPDSFRITGTVVKGIASYYSSNLDGSLTSTGERYRNRLLTAASNNIKLNTWVLVTNLRNNKTVIVRVNDRMHPRMKRKGRVLDLSQAAARQLDFIKAGLAKVKVDILESVPVEERPGDSVHKAIPDTSLQRDTTPTVLIKVSGLVNTDRIKPMTAGLSGIRHHAENIDKSVDNHNKNPVAEVYGKIGSFTGFKAGSHKSETKMLHFNAERYPSYTGGPGPNIPGIIF
jgi:rare lipoprotein A (peptidoglycan hydrolase)